MTCSSFANEQDRLRHLATKPVSAKRAEARLRGLGEYDQLSADVRRMNLADVRKDSSLVSGKFYSFRFGATRDQLGDVISRDGKPVLIGFTFDLVFQRQAYLIALINNYS